MKSVAWLLVAVLAPGVVSADWVFFDEQSASRIVADDASGLLDVEEKDYAWGDVDRDGDTDLVVARKQPWSSTGLRPNVLFLNEAGVLVDRTSLYAGVSDVPGDQGFLTPTNDRDVVLVDVNLDEWLDIVTAVALSPDEPKSVGHPRVYINLGEDAGTGDWLGFRHEDARIPTLLDNSGHAGTNPRFLAVAAGDVTNDGWPDLYFTDTDTGGADPPSQDFDDRLLVNLGAAAPGFFIDETALRLGGDIQTNTPFIRSGFAAAAAIVDVSGDSLNDVLKVNILTAPQYVGAALSNPSNPGFFDDYSIFYQGSATFFSTGDLNNDGLEDLAITDDGADRYLLNQGGATPSFLPFVFGYDHGGSGTPPSDAGFGGNSVVTDLNNDGWNDVMIADVDTEIPGCSRRLTIFRNAGGDPGGNVVLEQESSGSNCASFQGNPPSCLISGIPSDLLEGVHDVAVFDIDGDGWKDVVLGRCAGTTVLLNQPPTPAGRNEQLFVAKLPNGRLRFDWGASCAPSDDDHAIYEGGLGSFAGHDPLTCSTSGQTTFSGVPTPGNRYYLVVPHNGLIEGSHGTSSAGDERPQGDDPCHARILGACD